MLSKIKGVNYESVYIYGYYTGIGVVSFELTDAAAFGEGLVSLGAKRTVITVLMYTMQRGQSFLSTVMLYGLVLAAIAIRKRSTIYLIRPRKSQ